MDEKKNGWIPTTLLPTVMSAEFLGKENVSKKLIAE